MLELGKGDRGHRGIIIHSACRINVDRVTNILPPPLFNKNKLFLGVYTGMRPHDVIINSKLQKTTLKKSILTTLSQQ